MQQEFAAPFRFVLGMTRALVGLNVGVVEKTSLFSTRAKALLRLAEPARMDLTSVPCSSIPASIFSVI